MVLGGLIGWLMVQIGQVGTLQIGHWTWQIAIIYIPVLIYGFVLLPAKFPKTETSEAGIPMGELFKYTFTNPLVLGLAFLMMLTLSFELGPMRWIPEVLQAAGVHGILVLVWISGLMMVLRLFAEPFVEKLAPTGMLLASSFLTGFSLLLFSFVESGLFMLLIAATLFAGGVAFFMPTMVGLMSERFPKAGSLGIVLMIGFGQATSGTLNGVMGQIADSYIPAAIVEQRAISTLEQVEARFPTYIATAEAVSDEPAALAELGYQPVDVENVLTFVRHVLTRYLSTGELDGATTGNALRSLLEIDLEQEQAHRDEGSSIILPAANTGGRRTVVSVSPLTFRSEER